GQARQVVAGPLARARHVEYARGPDGRSYAVRGDVEMDVTPGFSAESTLSRAERVRQASLLGAASAADLSRAAAAAALASRARAQLVRARIEAAAREAREEGRSEAAAREEAAREAEQAEQANADPPP